MLKSLLVLSMLLVSAVASASGTVCSGSLVQYSAQRVDTGVPPPPGFKIGESTLFIRGDLVARVEYFSDAEPVGSFDYSVAVAPGEVLASGGNITAGWRVYEAVVTVVPTSGGGAIADRAICRDEWAYLP